MILTSWVSEKKYFWVKVPRTATHSYQQLFFPELHQESNYIFHQHSPFLDFSRSMCVKKPYIEHGVSVVRNPYDRFISCLKYLNMKYHTNTNGVAPTNFLHVCEFCGEVTPIRQEDFIHTITTPGHVSEWLKNEDTFYDFMYSYFDKNCELKPGYTWQEIFHTENPGLVQTVLRPQMFFAYHPKVKVFHYENISEFNDWIETTLGISTSNLTHENTSSHKTLNIDVSTKKFKDLVQYLYKDDFKVFGYS